MTKLQIYQVLHVLSVILLVGLTFSAFAAPNKERKRRVAIGTGLLSLIALVTGFGMISVLYANHFAGWMIVKLVVWLAIAALSGMAFRMREKTGMFAWLTAALVLVAVAMVYLKPF